MSDTLSIAIAQINPTVGDVQGNVARILDARARAGDADLVMVPELALSGYPPEDLVLKDAFLDTVKEGIAALAAATRDGGPALIVGAPQLIEERRHNTAVLLDDGAVAATVIKHHLPNYGVFDEARVFVPGPLPQPVMFRGFRLGLMICEDMWYEDVAAALGRAGAEILVVPNGSPFEIDKPDDRRRHAAGRVRETGLPLIYLNQICGQDELVFDGASFVLDAKGEAVHQLPSWREVVVTTRWRRDAAGLVCEPGALTPPPPRLEAIYQAMVLGLRDYVTKNRFKGVLLGLSGGIDSALSAAVAADALGADRVRCVMMPSPYTSRESLDDAAEVARLCGIRLDSISIGPAMEAFTGMLSGVFAGAQADTTEENVQARSRGLTLMAMSNKFGYMVLSTGNKSEMSVGYATLYGDMCGGYSVLKDLYKTTVFEVSRWRNAHRPDGALGPRGPVMPERVITKPPSAELKPDQKDQDTLPPYDQLDAILYCLIERELGPAETVAAGHDAAVVRRVFRMLDRAEYKRRQAPPGVKISSRAFGRDRRYPIVNGFTDTI
ncbi:NAD+ synthase [Telmatospirillum siberiense]|uniref:Glutamine-dependent NAD(+) synthetase n=1 Tax=Telmatospirillum siberiense TaxID=382514 RepID=A0A2N3PZI8_9PROT|nr:NAD+ synthase [Telmatospirillum siberiense]PKU25822.1 NAD+ synthase [Telmatospirillum siberiense]